MNEILSHFDPITLEQMNDVRLLNRTDTKFVTTVPMLKRLLTMAQDDYFVQVIDGESIATDLNSPPIVGGVPEGGGSTHSGADRP